MHRARMTPKLFVLGTLPLLLAAGLAIKAASEALSGSSLQPAVSRPGVAVKRIAVITDATVDAAGRHGLWKLKEALRANGVSLTEDADQLESADLVLLAGLGSGSGPAAAALRTAKAPAPREAEALTVRRSASYRGKPAVVLAGADGTGLMYAALDVAARVSWARPGGDPFQFVRDTAEAPYLKERGVVIFTMNQAYFESRLHDEQFWVRYLDMFAADRINRLVLTFGYEDGGYMTPIYPYFFDVDGFPEVRVVGLTAAQQARNFAALKRVFHLASERGILIKPGQIGRAHV